MFYRAPIHVSCEKGNPEILELLLKREKIDVNRKTIKTFCFFNSIQNINFFILFEKISIFIKFKINFVNSVSNLIV